MNCCVTDMRSKEVINSKSGCRLGQVCDVEIDTCTGCIVSLIIWGRPRCFGILGREEDIKIQWNDIEVIGDDTILVCADVKDNSHKNKRGVFDGIFRF